MLTLKDDQKGENRERCAQNGHPGARLPSHIRVISGGDSPNFWYHNSEGCKFPFWQDNGHCWRVCYNQEKRDIYKAHAEPIYDEPEQSNPLTSQVGGEHYKNLAIQPAEYTTRNGIGHLAGDAIAYITRYKAKNGRQDLEKAIHSIQLLIALEYGTEVAK